MSVSLAEDLEGENEGKMYAIIVLREYVDLSNKKVMDPFIGHLSFIIVSVR